MTRPDLSEYTVVLASAEQAEIQDRNCMIPWGRGLDFKDFVYVFSKKNTMTWVLVKRDDLQGEVYAGCETYLRQALVKQRDGTLKDGWAYNIEAVTTSPKHRGNGYATHLLRLLHYNIGLNLPPFPKSWGAPPPTPPIRLERATIATLWTDIGRDFYANCTIGESLPGYIVDETRTLHMHFDLKPTATIMTNNSDTKESRGWSFIYREDLPGVQKLLCSVVKQHLESDHVPSAALTLPLSEVFADNIPSIGQRYDELVTGKPWAQPVPLGVKIDETTIILFGLKHISLEPGLLILMTHNLKPAQLGRAFEAMDVVGGMMGHKHAIAWGTEKVLGQWQGETREIKIEQRPEIMGHLLATARYEDVEEIDDGQMWLWG